MAEETPRELALHDLRPAEGSHRQRKRVGRGAGSGTGKTSGRGQKGQKARSGSHRMRAGFEGGQMPAYMRLGKLRGPNHKKSMPMGPFRTHTTAIGLRDLERFDAGVEVTPELLRTAGVVKSRHPVKVLANGELTKELTVRVHAFSKAAAQAIEAAGGRAIALGEEDGAEAAPPAPEPEATVEEPAADEAGQDDETDGAPDEGEPQ
jgi:large subunit ribosomal protein L15